MAQKSDPNVKQIANNPRAFHLYHVRERLEAGLVLVGSEVKALREGRAQLRDAYAAARGEELYLYDCHIGPYSHTGYTTHEPTRPRKLLLHKREVVRLLGKLTLKGYTLIPLRLYFKRGHVKVELGLAEGKKLHDKREAAKRRDADREVEQALKQRRR